MIYTENEKTENQGRVPLDVEAISITIPYYDDALRKNDSLKLKSEDII